MHILTLLYSGVKGRLRDLCKATQRKYDIAIEVLMGRHNDSIVVDDEKTAMDCVEVRKLHVIPRCSIRTKLSFSSTYETNAQGE